jgi:hypothetical protein
MASFIKTIVPAVIVMAVVAVGASAVYTKYFNPGSDMVVSEIAPAAGDALASPVSATTNSSTVATGATDSVQGTTDTTASDATANGSTDSIVPTTTSPSTNAVTPANAAVGTTSTGEDAAATNKSLSATAPAAGQ